MKRIPASSSQSRDAETTLSSEALPWVLLSAWATIVTGFLYVLVQQVLR